MEEEDEQASQRDIFHTLSVSIWLFVAYTLN